MGWGSGMQGRVQAILERTHLPLPVDRRLQALALLGLGCLLGGSWFIGGPVGIGTVALSALVWGLLGPAFAIAAIHVGLLAVSPGLGDVVAITVLEAGLVVLVAVGSVTPPSTPATGRRFLAGFLVALAILGGVLWTAFESGGHWLAAATLLSLFGLGGFLVHRHARVTLSALGTDTGDGGGSA